MNSTILSNAAITKTFKDLLSWLSSKEKLVISKRAGLDGKTETLQWIWASFTPAITRERVRQIEDVWVQKMSRFTRNNTLLWKLQESAMNFIKLHGWVISSEKLINNVIKDLNISWKINYSMLEMILQANEDVIKSKQTLGCKIYFYLPTINKSDIESVHKEAIRILKMKKDVMNKNVLYEEVVKSSPKNISAVFVDSCLELFNDIVSWEENLIGLYQWKILNPRTLKDKTIYIMKKEGTPMHFVEITNKIIELLQENVKINTIHNELIRNPEFVLIGRGIYALKEWWFNAGTVLDVIVEILTKKWNALSTEEIVKEVLKARDVKITTIYMNLQNKTLIERVWRNYYQLKK